MLVAPDNWLLAQSEIDAVTAHKQGRRIKDEFDLKSYNLVNIYIWIRGIIIRTFCRRSWKYCEGKNCPFCYYTSSI